MFSMCLIKFLLITPNGLKENFGNVIFRWKKRCGKIAFLICDSYRTLFLSYHKKKRIFAMSFQRMCVTIMAFF